MSKHIQGRLFCTKCSLTFGNALTKFNTNFAFKVHSLIVHETNTKLTQNRGKKSFECENCGKSFSDKSHMNRHVASVHEGKKPFKCQNCGKSFFEQNKMKKIIPTSCDS